MSELPNNSEKALNSRPPEKRNAVVQREVQHRQTLGKMLRDSFIPKDVEHAGEYILKDMIVPGLRDGVFDILMGILDMWRGGVAGGGYRRSFGGYSGVPRIHQQQQKDYNQVSRIGSRNDRTYDVNRSVKSYDDIVIPDYPPSEGGMRRAEQEAEAVIAELKDTIRGYGVARVSDLREACKESSTPSEYNYGWTNLDNAGYDRVRGGWLLILPKAMPIDN